MTEGRQNRQFLASKLPYLRNGARQDNSHNDGLIEIVYALSIGTKIMDLGWPWTSDTHSIAEKMRPLEPTTQIWTISGTNVGQWVMTVVSSTVRLEWSSVETVEITLLTPLLKSTLLFFMITIRSGFLLTPIRMTLNDLECPVHLSAYVYCGFQSCPCVTEWTWAATVRDQKCGLRTVFSEQKRFVRISAGVYCTGGDEPEWSRQNW